MTKCPECEAEVPIPETVETGEIVDCPECGVELEVEGINPVKLKMAPQEDEDWGE